MTTLIKINPDGSQVYPYGMTELRREYPNTSFSAQPLPEELSHYSVFYVEPTAQPELGRYQKIGFSVEFAGNDLYREQWTVLEMDAAERLAVNERQGDLVRSSRNRLLQESDWTQLADVTADKAAWAAYRQALRDVTGQQGFPWDVIWPQAPN
jgi:hypothetical protein